MINKLHSSCLYLTMLALSQIVIFPQAATPQTSDNDALLSGFLDGDTDDEGIHSKAPLNRSNERSVGYNLQFTLLPSSIVEREGGGGLGDFGSIEREERENSGIGFSTSFSGFYRHKVGPKSKFTLSGTLSTSVFENSDSNARSGLITLSFEQSFDKGRWSIAPFYRTTWKANDTDSRAFGAQFQVQRRLSSSTILVFSARAEDRNYFEQPNTDHNGPRYSTSLGVNYKLSPGFSVLGGLRYRHNQPTRQNLQNREYAVFARATKTWDTDFELGFGVDLGQRRHIGTNQVIRLVGGTPTLQSITREEEFYSLNITIENPNLKYAGFTPSARCSYTDTTSNIKVFGYAVTSCKLTISRNF